MSNNLQKQSSRIFKELVFCKIEKVILILKNKVPFCYFFLPSHTKNVQKESCQVSLQMKNYSISLVGFLAAKASTVQGVDPNRSSGQLANSISQFSSQECHLFMHAPCTLRLPVSISGDFPRGKRVSSLDSEPT